MKTILKIICFILTFNLLLCSIEAQEVPGTYRVTFHCKDKKTRKFFKSGGSAVAFEKIEGDRVKLLTAGHLWWDEARDHLLHVGDKTYKVLKYKQHYLGELEEHLVEFHIKYVDIPITPIAGYDPPVNSEVKFSGFPNGWAATTTCRIKRYFGNSKFFHTYPPMPTFGYSGGPVIHDGKVVGIVFAFDRPNQVGLHLNIGLRELVKEDP